MNSEKIRLVDFALDITLIGGGKMGMALLAGWLEAGLSPGLVQVIDPHPSEPLTLFAAHNGFSVREEVGPMNGVVVLAIKPESLEVVASAGAALLNKRSIVLSIMAGIRIARLRDLFPGAGSIVRAMPNLPAAIGCGATALVAEHETAEADLDATKSLLAVSGLVEELEEEGLMDAATALSGSGPGYLFYIVECLVKAGERAGLPKATAVRLARRTVEGAGILLSKWPKSAGDLREEVTSPGGTTQAGLAVLARDERMAALLTDAVLAAAARARELAA